MRPLCPHAWPPAAPSRRGRAAAVVAVGLLTVGGCTSTDAGSSAPEPASGSEGAAADEPRAGGGTVLQPGRPGEPNETLGPDATVEATPWNEADVGFLNDMIPHHSQALEMAELARTRAEDREVRAFAARIGDAQGAEIVGMAAWLDQRDLDAPTAEDVEHHMSMSGMPGMLDPEQMDALAAADGARFDRLFLAGMIQHHQGAVAMAKEVLGEGSDIVVAEIADEVSAGQTAEIQRLRDLQRRIDG